ncbi:hypothetical protein HOU03_gp409 [Caulobacter phage CcrSC]|uniref:Uncharacterized protein n=1 Tax=Caulobacter phage CcrSC TaxID=2283272 RepID=A0A385EGF9_9CAUD|nr:hypothetical protein HOU03_gp409 [Caulobacter phage CcrSC]AXQ69859.1 hypothetical protein CcrSC_gp277c [Caulobacter phage CcrSC]
MTKEVIFETSGDDGLGLTYAYDLIEALSTAQHQCEEAEKEEEGLSFYVQDQSGRVVNGLRIVKETLTDGSFTHTIVLDMDF